MNAILVAVADGIPLMRSIIQFIIVYKNNFKPVSQIIESYLCVGFAANAEVASRLHFGKLETTSTFTDKYEFVHLNMDHIIVTLVCDVLYLLYSWILIKDC